MSDIYKEAASKLLTKSGWEKAEKYLTKLEKTKKPTDKFGVLQKAMSIIKDIAYEDDEIQIEYGYTNGTIYWRSYTVSIYKMELWRNLMSITDIFGIDILEDDRMQIELTYKDIFKVEQVK